MACVFSFPLGAENNDDSNRDNGRDPDDSTYRIISSKTMFGFLSIPVHSYPGSLNGIQSVLFFSQLFLYHKRHYRGKRGNCQ